MKQKTKIKPYVLVGKPFLVTRFMLACEKGDVKKVKRMLKEGKIYKIKITPNIIVHV